MVERKLLITDDQVGIRSLLEEVFRGAGYKVYTAAGGREALKIIRDQAIDIVLLDMKMIGIGGLETLKLIKGARPKTRVVIMSAYEEISVLKQAERLGAECYISKPFDLEKLKEIIRKVLAVPHP